MLEIAYIDTSKIDIEDKKLFNFLSSYKAEKIKKLHSDEKKRESAGAELLLSSLLGMLFPDMSLPPKIGVDTNGKPFLSDYPQIYFNLSHSDQIAACVISDCPVGIDIEHIATPNFEIAKRFFTENEQNFITTASDKTKAFYDIWTRKEALLKCTGRGLGAVSSTDVLDASGYKFRYTNLDDFMICVCIKNV